MEAYLTILLETLEQNIVLCDKTASYLGSERLVSSKKKNIA